MSARERCESCHGALGRPGAEAPDAARCPYCGSASPDDPSVALRLRPDLVIEPVEEGGKLLYVIKDPSSQRYFRIKPLEHFLISQFDGATPFAAIRRRASDEKHVLVSEEVLARFAEKFRALGLLVSDQEQDGPLPGRIQRVGPLSFKIPVTDPNALVAWVHRRVRPFIGPGFVWLLSLSILTAFALAVAHRDELAFGLADAVSMQGLALVLLSITAVTFVHEIAHAVTCRHFGGRVSDLGLLFLYLLPCFYVNVSDTYLFREKRQRLWVFFAGGFVELFVWSLAVIGWRIVTPETFVSRVLFVVAAVCGIRSLFNFNPLIKMDGYFLLSDYLGITNLRREAFAGLARALRRLAGLEVPEAAPELRQRRILFMRAERFLVLFGGTAIAYTVLLAGLLVALSAGFVFDQYGADALAVFSLALVGLLHKPAFTAASAAKEAGKEKWDQLGETRKRSRFTLLWGGLLLGAALFPWPLRVTSDLTVLPQERETVRAPFAGRIANIHVSEGDRVERGDLILEYDADELLLTLRAKQAELERAREELKIIDSPNPIGRGAVVVAERDLELARVRERGAERDFARAQDAWTAGVIPRDAFDRAENELNEAISNRRRAEARLSNERQRYEQGRKEDLIRQGISPDALRQKIRGLEEEVKTVEDQLSRTKIFASISGVVTTYRFEEKVGDYLEEGADVCEIVNDERVVLEMPVAEKDMDVIEDGLDVKFKVRGYPARSFHAKVDEIAPVATPNGISSTILIRSYIDNREKMLKPGMTGVAKIYCGMSVMAHILTRDLIRFVRTEFWL